MLFRLLECLMSEYSSTTPADDLRKADNSQNDAQSSCESSDEEGRSINIPVLPLALMVLTIKMV